MCVCVCARACGSAPRAPRLPAIAVTGILSFRRFRFQKRPREVPTANSAIGDLKMADFGGSGVPWSEFFGVGISGLGVIEFLNFGGPGLDVIEFWIFDDRIWM